MVARHQKVACGGGAAVARIDRRAIDEPIRNSRGVWNSFTYAYMLGSYMYSYCTTRTAKQSHCRVFHHFAYCKPNLHAQVACEPKKHESFAGAHVFKVSCFDDDGRRLGSRRRLAAWSGCRHGRRGCDMGGERVALICSGLLTNLRYILIEKKTARE